MLDVSSSVAELFATSVLSSFIPPPPNADDCTHFVPSHVQFS
jgi:hypothetical protein